MINILVSLDANRNHFSLHTLSKLVNFKCRDSSFLFHIMFVASKYNILLIKIAISFILILPSIQIIETIFVCDVEQDNTTVSSPIITSSQMFEPFLPSSIPYLYLKDLIFPFDSLNLEIDSHSCHVVLRVFVQRIFHHEGWLPATWISYDDHLE